MLSQFIHMYCCVNDHTNLACVGVTFDLFIPTKILLLTSLPAVVSGANVQCGLYL